MSQDSEQRAPSSVDWHASAVRVTAFLAPNAEVEATNWWNSVVGESPDKSTSQPKIGTIQEEGQFLGGKLILLVQPGRVDWALNKGGGPETLGAFDAVVSSFETSIAKWLETAPPLQRLAFGSILVIPVDDRETGYARLAAFLPSIILAPTQSSDFFYQINRPRTFHVEGADLKLNRLTKWSVAAWQDVKISFEDEIAEYALDAARFACRLELDISTDETYQGSLPRAQLAHILDKLVQTGLEIAREGDRP
jgi:hypothetical protein